MANILEIDSLRLAYRTRGTVAYAMNDVTLTVAEGEAVGLVGESGSGKSTLARATLRGVAYLMITHDISIARHFADRVAVMQHGVIVETGPAAGVLTSPSHPYTKQLVAAVPVLEGPSVTT